MHHCTWRKLILINPHKINQKILEIVSSTLACYILHQSFNSGYQTTRRYGWYNSIEVQFWFSTKLSLFVCRWITYGNCQKNCYLLSRTAILQFPLLLGSTIFPNFWTFELMKLRIYAFFPIWKNQKLFFMSRRQVGLELLSLAFFSGRNHQVIKLQKEKPLGS